MRFLLLLFLYFILPSQSYGQSYSFNHYDTKDGLAGATVHGMVQSKDGFMWFATETGLSRFDGIHFKNFSMADGLPSNELFGCFVDRKNRIWLAPFKPAVCYYENGKIHNQDNDSLLSKIHLNGLIQKVSESEQGDIILEGDYETHILTYDNRILKLPIGNLKRTTPVPNPIRIVSGNNNLTSNLVDMPYEIRRQINPDWFFIDDILKQNVKCYVFRNRDTVKIISVTGDTDTILLSKKRTAIFFLNDHEYVILNKTGGIELVNLKNPERSGTYFKDYFIQFVWRDKEENLWFTTKGSGVFKISDNRFKNLFSENKERPANIIDIHKIGTHIFVGGYNDKYWKFNAISNVFFTKDITNKPTPFFADAAFLRKIPYGTFINAGSSNFLNLRRKKTNNLGAFKTIHVLGDTLLIACSNGAFLLDQKRNTIGCLFTKRATCAYRSGNTYYIGTLDGLYKKEPDSPLLFMGVKFPNLKKEISSFAMSKDSTIWVGTNGGGVIGYRNGRICAVLNKNNGLASDLCRCLFVQNNILWVGTEKGLNRVDIGAGEPKVTATITANDGLNSDIVNTIFNDGDFVYVGTPLGVTVFDQKNIRSYGICDLNMTGITVSGSRLDPLGDNVHLAHKDNNISFEYSGISFLSGGDISYKYRVLGLSDQWTITKESILTYPSLPSGKYVLELIALNKFGEESKLLRYHFEIEKSIPETIWFKIMAGFLSILIISLLAYFIIQAYHKKKNEKMMIDHKIKSLEQMALRAQMNPHFIFNCLNSMQEYILHGDVRKVNFYLARFAGLVRDTLNNATKMYISVEQELSYLNAYIDLVRLQHAEIFDYDIHVDPEIDQKRTKIPNMVLQPYVENAIKHGVCFSPQQGKLLVRFKLLKEEGLLECVVEDNGPGIASAGGGNAQSKPLSKGMSITDQRITTLNELNRNTSPIKLQVIDLGLTGHGTGTKIIIHFPI